MTRLPELSTQTPMIKRVLATLAAISMAAPAAAAPFMDRSGDIITNINSRTYPNSMNMLFDKGQWASEPQCIGEYCTQDVYALYMGQVYYLLVELDGDKVGNIMLVRTGPLNQNIRYDGYFTEGTYHVSDKCEIQIFVKNVMTGSFIINETTPLAQGYSCPV